MRASFASHNVKSCILDARCHVRKVATVLLAFVMCFTLSFPVLPAFGSEDGVAVESVADNSAPDGQDVGDEAEVTPGEGGGSEGEGEGAGEGAGAADNSGDGGDAGTAEGGGGDGAESGGGAATEGGDDEGSGAGEASDGEAAEGDAAERAKDTDEPAGDADDESQAESDEKDAPDGKADDAAGDDADKAKDAAKDAAEAEAKNKEKSKAEAAALKTQEDDEHPDVIETVSDEGVKVRYHITSGNTVELGTGLPPSKDYTTVDYDYTGAITIPETIKRDNFTYTVTGIAESALAPYYVGLSRICCKVSRIIIPETVTKIGTSALSYTTSLRSISIPDSVTSLGSSAFAYSGVSKVDFSGTSTISTIPDSCFSGTGIADIDFIPESVTALGSYAFSSSDIRNTVVPAQISSMGYGVFAGCRDLVHAEFAGTPPGNEIPAHTFNGCRSLSDFDFTNGIKSIESYAFYNTGFPRITIPCAITYLGDYAFGGCARLLKFSFEEGHELLDISDGLFAECTHLGTVELPKTIRTLGTKAFSGCTALESISLPPTIRSLGDFALEECTSLALVTFEGDAAYVSCSSSTFYLANALKSVVFLGKKATTLTYPSAMPTIYYTVSYYLSWGDIGTKEPYARHIVAANAIPSKATEAQTFDGAYLATAPSGATWAYEDGFSPTGEIVDSYYAYVPGATKPLDVGDTFVANTVEGVPVTYTVTAKPNGTNPGKATVGWSNETGSQAAIDLNTTGAVTLPQKVVGSDGKTYDVTAIEGYAFLNCRRIVSVTIPATVKSIGPRAFSRCAQLRNIYFESDAQTITDDGIFAGCGGIARVIFGGKKANLSFGTSSPDVYYTVFYYESKHDRDIDNRQSTLVVHERARLDSLKKAEVYSGSIPALKTGFEWAYETGFGGNIPLTDSTKVYAEGVGFQYQVQVVGGNVDRTDCWFKILTFDEKAGTGTCMVGLGKDNITAVHTGVSGMPVIPQAVTDADGNVFKVTEVSDYAFGSESYWLACHYITSVSLPPTIEAIGKGAFENCQLMESISVPAAVESIGKVAFKGCTALTSVTFGSGSRLRAIPERCFEGDDQLKSIRIPDGVRSIGKRAFADCYGETNNGTKFWGIESVNLPASVETIGDEAFSNDGCLMLIDIPASCTHVGEKAFFKCWHANLIRFNGNAANMTFGDRAFDLRAYDHNNRLDAIIFMDKKSTTAPDYISLADAQGKPKELPPTYYCIRFYSSQDDFESGRVKNRLVIKHDVAAVHYTDGFYSGSYPSPGTGTTWRSEPGFGVSKRTTDSYYAVLGRDISLATVSVNPTDYFYTGGYITPEPVVRWGDAVLKKGVDYVMDSSKGEFGNGYTNNRHGPEARVFVQGIGEYAGSAYGTFNISLQTNSADSFTVDFKEKMLYVYDGKPKTPAVTVSAKLGGNPYAAVEGEDYVVEYRNNVNAGVGEVVVRGKGVFGGEFVMPFTINPMSILKCSVTGLKSKYSLDGGYASPTVSLANPSGVPLVEGVDYRVTYSNNSSSGVGTLRIIGMGNYTGAMSKSFTIVGGGGKGNGNGNGNGSGKGKGSGKGEGKGEGDGSVATAAVASNAGGDVAPTAAPAASAEGGSEGGSGYNIFRISSEQPDIVVTVEQNWWWILVLLIVLGLIAAGMFNQRQLFAKQLLGAK